MIETLIIARHGFRQNWVSDTWTTPTGMPRDPPLAAYGIEQAERLGDHLASPSSGLPKPDLVFSSAFYRCIQTSRPLATKLGVPIRLEHGVGEWYSPTPDSDPRDLHPRPGSASHLSQFFPPSLLETSYAPTLYPSRRGETLAGLLSRTRTFLAAFVPRTEAEHPDAKCVVLVGHAASVIALGRGLTGQKDLEVVAGCCSFSVYSRRKDGNGGVGEWEIVKNGEAGFLEKGVERNWSFSDVTLTPEGEVITDKGVPGTAHEGDSPCGLGPGMDKWLPTSFKRDEEVRQAKPLSSSL